MTRYTEGEKFPWGERSPASGYKVGDHIGMIYSDHERYRFDNPTGIITDIKTSDYGEQWLTIQVTAEFPVSECYLIERKS